MVKRVKKLDKAIESLKEQIERHFLKIEDDIQRDNFDLGRYHAKEIDKSLIDALEKKINMLEDGKDYLVLIKNYRNRLSEYKKKLGFEG